jgi:hypothetical protein
LSDDDEDSLDPRAGFFGATVLLLLLLFPATAAALAAAFLFFLNIMASWQFMQNIPWEVRAYFRSSI